MGSLADVTTPSAGESSAQGHRMQWISAIAPSPGPFHEGVGESPLGRPSNRILGKGDITGLQALYEQE